MTVGSSNRKSLSITHNINYFKANLPAQVQLVCVSKFHPISAIQEAYNTGQRIFGESKVQELMEKHAQLPSDIVWHFIGHLQSNKIKNLIPFVTLIHGVDSAKLLVEIDKEAKKHGCTVNCLLQVHIAQETTKFGFSREELLEFVESEIGKQLQHVTICGLMGMATYTDNAAIIRKEFSGLKSLFDELKSTVFSTNELFKELSMGMSDDYKIAVEEGSTMIRIGSAIFGPRL